MQSEIKFESFKNRILNGRRNLLVAYKKDTLVTFKSTLILPKSLKVWTGFSQKIEWRAWMKTRTTKVSIWCSHSLRLLISEQLTARNKHLIQLFTPRTPIFFVVCCLTRRRQLIWAGIVQNREPQTRTKPDNQEYLPRIKPEKCGKLTIYRLLSVIGSWARRSSADVMHFRSSESASTRAFEQLETIFCYPRLFPQHLLLTSVGR